MTKHACGSCRFFQQARDSKQGWCTHPDRRETTAVRILVRSAELRCRNDWGADLWQERVDSDRVLDIVMNDSPSKTHPDSSARPIPAPVVEPRPHIEARPIVFPATDVAEPDRVTDTEQAKLVSDNLNRELLRRAHDQARERVRNRGYAAELNTPSSLDAPVEREALVISNQYVPPSREIKPDADAPGIFEFNNKAGTGKFDERVVSSVPSDHSAARPARDSETSATRYQLDESITMNDSGTLSYPATPPVNRSGMAAEPRWVEDEADVFSVLSVPLGENEVPPTSSNRPYRNSRLPIRSSRYEHDETPLFDAPIVRQHDEYDVPDGLGVPPIQMDEYLSTPGDESATWPAESLNRSTEGVWSGIVKTCQTCRDFRPAGNGQRGWCTNQWAFKHRRMVDAQDRPCETSIGHWWIPGDVAWQGSLDIAALGQPTPNVDKYLGRDETPEIMPVRRRR